MNDELRCFRNVAKPRLTVVCMPHAGGNATAFRHWPAHLPPDVALSAARYPGRLDRSREPAAETIADLAGPLTRAVAAIDGPVVLFGHSMGAVVALAMAAHLEDIGRPPVTLVVSGREAPHLTSPEPSPTGDEALLAMSRGLGGMPDDILADEELRELVLAPLRADTRVLNAVRGEPVRTVTTPIVAYLGVDDPGCTPAQIDGWRTCTTGSFDRRLVAGDHFSVLAEPGEILNDLTRRFPG